jgi:hypothetical protein
MKNTTKKAQAKNLEALAKFSAKVKAGEFKTRSQQELANKLEAEKKSTKQHISTPAKKMVVGKSVKVTEEKGKTMKQIRQERTELILNLITVEKSITNAELVVLSGLNIFIVNGVIGGLMLSHELQIKKEGKYSRVFFE